MIENEVSVLGAWVFRTTSMATGLRAYAIDLGPFGRGEVSGGRPRRYRLSGAHSRSDRMIQSSFWSVLALGASGPKLTGLIGARRRL
jgi:hypothetical protein